ncbi:MAG: T9SS type A sorting domain-containing protein [Bacteroidales bacterium]|nr:T9SS type A sorting domain-containing protein [Bacteroidales bacterium]
MKNIIFFFTLFISLVVVKPDYAQNFFEEIIMPDTAFLRCMAINEEGDLFIGTGGNNTIGGILRLQKGSETWETVYSYNSRNSPLCLEIADNGDIYAGGNSAAHYLIKSSDNGESWVDVEIPGGCNVVAAEFQGGDSIMIGRNPSRPIVAHTTNGGLYWFCDTITSITNNFIEDIEINSQGEVYACMYCFNSDHGGIYKSDNFGESWVFDGLLDHQIATIEFNSKGDLFSGDYYVVGNEVPGVYCKAAQSDEYELVIDAVGASDIVITNEDKLYVCTDFWIYGVSDYGQSVDTIRDELGLNICHLEIDNDGYLWGGHELRLIRSKEPVCIPVGIKQETTGNLLNIHPNPSNSKFHVESLINENINNIKIFDLKGNTIIQINSINNRSETIDLSEFAAGTYIVQINYPSQTQSQKIIKSMP